MIIKALGFLDFVGILMLFLGYFKVVDPLWLTIVAGYLLLKGWLFFLIGKDVASVLDFIAGIVVLIMAFIAIPGWLFIVLIVWIIQKAVFSFI